MRFKSRLKNFNYTNFSNEYLFREQYAYGHREILLKAADLPPETQLYGRVQHGWDPLMTDPVGPFRPLFFKEAWQWVWTSSNEALGKERGVHKVKAIGAPWLYLLEQLGIPLFKPSEHRKTGKYLLMPSHINEMSSTEFHSQQILRALSYASAENWTVMLHGLDFMTMAIRDLYTASGLFITTAGWPVVSQGGRHPSSSIGDRRKFLENIVKVMRDVELLLTDEVGTHILYATSLGIDVMIKPIAMDKKFSGASEQVEGLVREEKLIREWQKRSKQYNSESIITPNVASDIAGKYLGLNSKLDNLQLRTTLLAK